MSSYKVGQLSALMTSGSAVSGKKKKKADKLNLLFSTPLPNPKEDGMKSIHQFELSVSPIEETAKRRKKKKKVINENHTQETAEKVKKKHGENINPVSSNEEIKENTSHQEEEMPTSEMDAEKKQRMAKKRKREDSECSKDFIKIDDTRNARTVFVGNLPTSFNKEDLKALFRPFGNVESTRIRSAAPPKVSLPKKVAVIKHLYHPEVHSFNGFVVFETEEMANAALELDGSTIQGHHIRVDIANKSQEHDHKRSVFVGNLPYDIDDDDLWDFFKDIGDIRQVRIIRDKETRIGKGFGYVLFKTIDAAVLALEKNGKELKGRPVRISRSTKQEKKIPIIKLSKKDNNKQFAKKGFQGRVAKKRLKMKKNKKIAKNRMRLKRKKMLAEKLQAVAKKNSND